MPLPYPEAHAPRVICVTGMHRSGTSLAARAVNLLGVSFGTAASLLLPGPDNPAGYWENRAVKELDDVLLAHLGGSWDHPPLLLPGWELAPDLDPLVSQAAEIVARDLVAGDHRVGGVVGFKDPRLALLLPFWMRVRKTDGSVVPQLIVPYTLDSNDMRFSSAQGFAQGDDFYTYLKDAFDVLYAEGDPQGADAPKMLSIGMHCRLLGRPGRMRSLQRFLDYVQGHTQVWICRRLDIARHWRQVHPFPAGA